MKKAIYVFAAVAMISGCAQRSTLMKNADGKLIECASVGYGWLGAPVAIIDHNRCVEKAKENGFVSLANDES